MRNSIRVVHKEVPIFDTAYLLYLTPPPIIWPSIRISTFNHYRLYLRISFATSSYRRKATSEHHTNDAYPRLSNSQCSDTRVITVTQTDGISHSAHQRRVHRPRLSLTATELARRNA